MAWIVASYIWSVCGHPAHMLVAFVAAGVFGLWTLRESPYSPEAAFLPVLLLQMFAASTGFSRVADRGHCDQLLVSGAPRWLIAIGHWLISGMPGVATWMALAVVEPFLVDVPGIGMRAPGLIGLLLVTTVAWTVTLPLPRLSAGVVWVLAIAMMTGLTSGRSLLAGVVEPGAPTTMSDVWTNAVVLAICPFLVLGASPDAVDRLQASLVIDIGFCLAAIVAGIVYITRRSYPCTVDQ